MAGVGSGNLKFYENIPATSVKNSFRVVAPINIPIQVSGVWTVILYYIPTLRYFYHSTHQKPFLGVKKNNKMSGIFRAPMFSFSTQSRF